MRQEAIEELAREIAKIAIAVESGHVQGVCILAVHDNGTSSELLVVPPSVQGMEKMMFSLDRLHFRARVAAYLAKPPGATGH